MNHLAHFLLCPPDDQMRAGTLIAEAMAGTAERFDVFAQIPHQTFPGGTLLRHPLLVLAMLWYVLRDKM